MTQTSFNPNLHLTQLKSKQGSQDYLEVKWRLVWFRDRYPNGTIDTEEVEVDLDREVETEVYVWNAEKRRSEKVIKQAKGYARFRTIATNGEGGRATGTKTETGADFPDFVEKAETGSVGRALAMLGFGTQFTGDELEERDRIVDSPVDHSQRNGSAVASTPTPAAPTSPVNVPAELKPAPVGTGQVQRTEQSNGSTEQPGQTQAQSEAKATEQQLSSIRKLYGVLNEKESVNLDKLSYFGAKKLLVELTTKYKALRQSQQASQPTDSKERARLDMIARAKVSFDALPGDLLWDTVKRDALGKPVEDAVLTVPQVVEINKLIALYEKELEPSKAS